MKKRNALIAIIFILCSLISLSSCGTDDIDISSYADEKIVLKGISEKDIVVTIAELKELRCVTKKTHSTSDKIGEVKATGPELDSLLEKYGCSKDDFSKIVFKGTDQYDVRLLKDYFTEHDLYLAFGVNGEPLDAESAPCRLIIPKSDSSYWIRMINEIDFIK